MGLLMLLVCLVLVDGLGVYTLKIKGGVMEKEFSGFESNKLVCFHCGTEASELFVRDDVLEKVLLGVYIFSKMNCCGFLVETNFSKN